MSLAGFLTSKGVRFVMKDIVIDEEAREEVLALGVRSTPVLVVDGEVVIGFDRAKITALLDL